MKRFQSLLAAAVVLLHASAAMAHEFWIEPDKYRLSPGDRIVARAMNGQDFEGIQFSYQKDAFARAGVITGAGTMAIEGEKGARPAIDVPTAGDGLHIVYQATPMASLVYDDLAKFSEFLAEKHLEDALKTHEEKGFPKEKIKEIYFRFVKSLVAVGSGRGADKPVGMPWELVALDNPYTHGGDIRIGLLSDGKTVADYYIFVFRRHDGQVDKLELHTDGKGVVTVPHAPGEYMVNAVAISEPPAQVREQTKAPWMTVWASMTYEIAN